MESDLFLMPVTAKITVVIGVLVALLVIFDLVLVRGLKLGKRAWKRVDYIWLSFAALGLVSTASQVRMTTAADQAYRYELFSTAAWGGLISLVDRYASNPDWTSEEPMCRNFVYSQYPAVPEVSVRIQAEYKVACDWVKKMKGALARPAASFPEPMDPKSLPAPPDVSDGQLRQMFRAFDDELRYFNEASSKYRIARENARQTELERALSLLAPFLLSCALALRITKVTGELMLER